MNWSAMLQHFKTIQQRHEMTRRTNPSSTSGSHPSTHTAANHFTGMNEEVKEGGKSTATTTAVPTGHSPGKSFSAASLMAKKNSTRRMLSRK